MTIRRKKKDMNIRFVIWRIAIENWAIIRLINNRLQVVWIFVVKIPIRRAYQWARALNFVFMDEQNTMCVTDKSADKVEDAAEGDEWHLGSGRWEVLRLRWGLRKVESDRDYRHMLCEIVPVHEDFPLFFSPGLKIRKQHPVLGCDECRKIVLVKVVEHV